jgi:hypothetical protein
MSAPPALKVISYRYPVLSRRKAGRQSLLITDALITSLPQNTIMRLRLFFLGLAALVQMSCSQNEVGNTTGQPQAAGESQDSGGMPLENGFSTRLP